VGPVDCHYRHELVETYNPRNLTFVGELPHEDTMRRIASCDLFVLPSYTEGFPNVILEAMALGRPIAASSVGAIGDMLSGGCGFVFPPRDVEAVKAALFTLTKDESRRLSLGERARDKVYREYLGDRVFAHYLNLWQRLAGSVSGRVSDVTQHDRKGKHQLS
jgi:glycosyltransferase involved in cell wall biosynthesis